MSLTMPAAAKRLAHELAADECGFILSAELVLIMTIGVLALVVGINALAKSINFELADLAAAFGSLNQTWWSSGFVNLHGNAGAAPWGQGFVDLADECDCSPVVATGRGLGYGGRYGGSGSWNGYGYGGGIGTGYGIGEGAVRGSGAAAGGAVVSGGSAASGGVVGAGTCPQPCPPAADGTPVTPCPCDGLPTGPASVAPGAVAPQATPSEMPELKTEAAPEKERQEK